MPNYDLYKSVFPWEDMQLIYLKLYTVCLFDTFLLKKSNKHMTVWTNTEITLWNLKLALLNYMENARDPGPLWNWRGKKGERAE